MHRTVLLLSWAAVASGQAPAFEVASIKPAAPQTGHQQFHMTMTADPGRVDFVNASLTDLVRTAYRVGAYQVKGPDWMPTQKFDVLARLPDGAAREQIPDMLQGLLADRFHLSIHHDEQVLPGAALVVAKSGLKLARSTADSGRSGWSRSFAADGSMHMEVKKITMSALADLIAGFLGYPVSDRTGVVGEYDLSLDFSPEDLSSGSRSAGVTVPNSDDSAAGSAIPFSLQRGGLKLEFRKMPMEIIVVDRLEKVPAAN